MTNQALNLTRQHAKHPQDQADTEGRNAEQQPDARLDLQVILLEDFEADQGHLHAVMDLVELGFGRLSLLGQ